LGDCPADYPLFIKAQRFRQNLDAPLKVVGAT
jgi:hypothetical protein